MNLFSLDLGLGFGFGFGLGLGKRVRGKWGWGLKIYSWMGMEMKIIPANGSGPGMDGVFLSGYGDGDYTPRPRSGPLPFLPPRFVVPLPVPLEKKWHVLQHKKFPQKLTITKKKKRMQRLIGMKKRQLPKEMPHEKPKETENLKEGVRPTSKKTKFGKKATKDKGYS